VAGEDLKGGLQFTEQDSVKEIMEGLLSKKTQDVTKPKKTLKSNKPVNKKNSVVIDDSPLAINDLDLSDI
jgi:hypothetical protein